MAVLKCEEGIPAFSRTRPRKTAFCTTTRSSVADALTKARTRSTNSPVVCTESPLSRSRCRSRSSRAGLIVSRKTSNGSTRAVSVSASSAIDLHAVRRKRVAVLEAHEPKRVRSLDAARVKENARDARLALHLFEQLRRGIDGGCQRRRADEEGDVLRRVERSEASREHSRQRREILVGEVGCDLSLRGREAARPLQRHQRFHPFALVDRPPHEVGERDCDDAV